MNDRQGTCAERIAQQMSSREESLRELFEAVNSIDEERAEEAREELDSFALGASTKVLLRIDLSTGGPADYLTAECEQERYGLSVERVTYHFADWFDHAEEDVPENSPLWQYAEQVAEYHGAEQ